MEIKPAFQGGNIMIYFAYAMAWASTAIAACYGMKVTGSAWCLWALFLPACIKIG